MVFHSPLGLCRSCSLAWNLLLFPYFPLSYVINCYSSFMSWFRYHLPQEPSLGLKAGYAPLSCAVSEPCNLLTHTSLHGPSCACPSPPTRLQTPLGHWIFGLHQTTQQLSVKGGREEGNNACWAFSTDCHIPTNVGLRSIVISHMHLLFLTRPCNFLFTLNKVVKSLHIQIC